MHCVYSVVLMLLHVLTKIMILPLVIARSHMFVFRQEVAVWVVIVS